jgi:hypothetical protein
MYGNPLGLGGYLTEIPFLLNNKIERIYKDAAQLQDLEADIAIANFTRSPENSGNDTGWNYLRLPKVKVQLAIQAEHYDEYLPEWVDGITHNFDGSICYPFNKPFWDFDDTIHDCFAKSYWIEKNVPIKPVFYFDPMVKWNHFYIGPVDEFQDYGYVVGSQTIHRDRIINSSNQFRYMFGDMRDEAKIREFVKSGIGFNIHKFQLKGLCPETDGIEIKYGPKTESIKLAYFYNLGMAVVSEKLDKTFPERFKDCIVEVDDMESYKIDKEQLKDQVVKSNDVLDSYHDLDTEQNILIDNIKKEFGL